MSQTAMSQTPQQDCLDHAARSREQADQAVDPQTREHFLTLERRWRRLADSYAYIARVETFLQNVEQAKHVRTW